MKQFFKRTGLFYLYFTLANFAGSLVGVFLSLPARLMLQKNIDDAYLIEGLFIELSIVSILFFLMQRDCYEERQFTPKYVVLPALVVCIIRWSLWVGTSGKIAFWATGGATSFSPLLFPNISFMFRDTETIWCDLISTIFCDVVFILPAFIGGGYWGYKRRIRENEKMITEHTSKTK